MSFVRGRVSRFGLSRQRRHRPDYWLVLLSSVLLVIGLIVVYAISPGLSVQKHVSENYYVGKQLIAALLAIVAFVMLANIPLSFWRHVQRPVIFFALIATLIALILPANADYPAHRWIRFGGLSLQSVEFIKFAVIICVAGFLVQQKLRGTLASPKTVQTLLVVLGVIGLVVGIAQKDLGSTAVIAAMMFSMAFLIGFPLKRLLIAVVLVGVAGAVLILPFSYRRARLQTFFTPAQDCQNAGYQACQALIAVGSGGMFGLGLSRSVQAYGYLPEAANDSIFAIYAEKFGFVGTTVLLGLFMALFSRLKRIMDNAPDDYSRLIIAGILAWLSTQTIINVGAMIGLLPLKGITLPFISYGGTSLLFVTGAIGLAFQISRYTSYGRAPAQAGEGTARYDDTSDRRRLRGAYHPNPGSR